MQQGRLNRVARENLQLGESLTLKDNTKITFSGVERYVSLQISHNPTQLWMLGFAIAVLSGLITSLIIKRRRIWIRVSPTDENGDQHTVVEVGGLARTDQAGYGEEFTRIAAELTRKRDQADSRSQRADAPISKPSRVTDHVHKPIPG